MMNLKNIPSKSLYGYTAMVLLLGVIIGYVIFSLMGKTTYISSHAQGSNCISGLTFIKPSLDCEVSDQKLEQLSTLKERLEVLIDFYEKSGKIDKVGVFVRDLQSTRFVGINDNDEFVMASLLKTPILISVFKLAEVQPKVLEQEILYSGGTNDYTDQNYQVEQRLVPGKNYSILELVTRSVEYSDNVATKIVSDYLAPGYLTLILEAYGIGESNQTDGEDYVSARIYSNIFRSLYNASYLTSQYSNQALSILSNVKFHQGAVAKLPSDTVVAHKFAERSGIRVGSKIVNQLHDCGIVYAREGSHPYTFCILTQGENFDQLEEVLQELSLEIYDAMSVSNKN